MARSPPQGQTRADRSRTCHPDFFWIDLEADAFQAQLVAGFQLDLVSRPLNVIEVDLTSHLGQNPRIIRSLQEQLQRRFQTDSCSLLVADE